MSRKAKAAPAGAPAWMVTFADLMSLLVCFFVLIISFSIMDDEKLQVVAGSLKDAFGIQKEKAVTGIVEIFGSPFFDYQKILSPTQIPLITQAEPNESEKPEDADFEETQAKTEMEDGPEEGTYEDNKEHPSEYLAEQEELHQAEQQQLEESQQQLEEALEQEFQSDPEMAELRDNLDIAQIPAGLRIQLLDQEDQPMFAMGSYRLLDRPKKLLEIIAQAIAKLPNRVTISGHTDGLPYRSNNGYNNWDLSADRSNATRRALIDYGVRPDQIDAVVGRADAEHMFPDDPYDPRNRRISIVIQREFLPPDPSPVQTMELDGQSTPMPGN